MHRTPERSLRKGITSERVPDKFPFRIDRGQLSRQTQSPPHRKYRHIVCSSQETHRTRWRGQVRVNGHTTTTNPVIAVCRISDMISVADMEYNNNLDSTPEVVMINVTYA